MGYPRQLFYIGIQRLVPIFGKDYLKDLEQIQTLVNYIIHRLMVKQKE